MQMVNPNLPTDIHKLDTYLCGSYNAGATAIYYNRMVRTSFGDIESWLNQHGMDNMLSIPVLTKKLGFRIMYDSDNDYWTVTKDDVSTKFYEDKQGLPYTNTAEQGLLLVQTGNTEII